jgi:hypothetical protein
LVAVLKSLAEKAALRHSPAPACRNAIRSGKAFEPGEDFYGAQADVSALAFPVVLTSCAFLYSESNPSQVS